MILYPFPLTFTPLWANSANDKLMIFFSFFQENKIRHFGQIVTIGDSLQAVSNAVICEN